MWVLKEMGLNLREYVQHAKSRVAILSGGKI